MSVLEDSLAMQIRGLRQCRGCKKEFVPRHVGGRHKGIYCSRECNGKDRYVQAACPTCGREFTYRLGDPRKYCSQPCAVHGGSQNASWKGGKVRVQCTICGIGFETFPSTSDRTVCSQVCFGKQRSVKSVGKANPNWRGATAQVACSRCGKETRIRTSSRAVANYCSKSCFVEGEFKGRDAKRWSTAWGKGNKKVGKRIDLNGQFFRSSWEANYARYLNFLKVRGEVLEWKYEARTFEFDKIRKGTRFYTPDFEVIVPNGTEYHEVKGWRHPKGETALRRMARYHPSVKIVLIDAPIYRAIEKAVSPLISNWERATGKMVKDGTAIELLTRALAGRN